MENINETIDFVEWLKNDTKYWGIRKSDGMIVDMKYHVNENVVDVHEEDPRNLYKIAHHYVRSQYGYCSVGYQGYIPWDVNPYVALAYFVHICEVRGYTRSQAVEAAIEFAEETNLYPSTVVGFFYEEFQGFNDPEDWGVVQDALCGIRDRWIA